MPLVPLLAATLFDRSISAAAEVSAARKPLFVLEAELWNTVALPLNALWPRQSKLDRHQRTAGAHQLDGDAALDSRSSAGGRIGAASRADSASMVG